MVAPQVVVKSGNLIQVQRQSTGTVLAYMCAMDLKRMSEGTREYV